MVWLGHGPNRPQMTPPPLLACRPSCALPSFTALFISFLCYCSSTCCFADPIHLKLYYCVSLLVLPPWLIAPPPPLVPHSNTTFICSRMSTIPLLLAPFDPHVLRCYCSTSLFIRLSLSSLSRIISLSLLSFFFGGPFPHPRIPELIFRL